MKVILFGATGMVGQGVLRECRIDADVERVLVVGRSPTGQQHAKLREILHNDFFDFSAIESELTGYDACFFCLGVSSVGMDAQRYRHLTYDLTMATATKLARLNPAMVFTYVTGRGTDSTEQGPLMWARVKRQDRKRPAQAAVQGGLYVPSRGHPAAARRQVEDRLGAGDLCGGVTSVRVARTDFAEICDDNRAGRPRHDQRRARRLSQAAAGERGHQSVLVAPSFRGDAQHRTRNLEIPRCAICTSEVHSRSFTLGLTADQFRS
jgi:hypothetical protein